MYISSAGKKTTEKMPADHSGEARGERRTIINKFIKAVKSVKFLCVHFILITIYGWVLLLSVRVFFFLAGSAA